MTKLFSILLVMSIALAITACAAKSDKVKVTCPACGYEFDALTGR